MYIPGYHIPGTEIPMLPKSNPTCPKCHKKENIKSVCRECGYEYPEEADEPYTVKDYLSIALMVIVGLLGSTGLAYFITHDPNESFCQWLKFLTH
ncbi:MAG: hypothetical protein WC365_08265 [Candidatus Babeliales bacterium]|jgi:hypothetical protein